LKEGREFELRRESGSRFHSLGAEKWNAREPVTVLYRGSAYMYTCTLHTCTLHTCMLHAYGSINEITENGQILS